MTALTLEPIGYLHSPRRYKYEQPRQSTLHEQLTGYIELEGGYNFEQALTDLSGFSHIWLIYQFHLNENWKPKVNPPRDPGRKIGVFATRSPHRPNPIGMSCVELVKIDGRRLYLKNYDLLDGTPILDIKPYLSYCDAFPEASTGWLPTEQEPEIEVIFSEQFERQGRWLIENAQLDPFTFAEMQLNKLPTSSKRKRVYHLPNDHYELGYRTWRLLFEYPSNGHTLTMQGIRSNYTADDLAETADKYGDKPIHRQFNQTFGD